MRETGSVGYTQLPTHTAANTAVVVRTSPFRRFLLTHFGHFRIEFFLQFSIAGNIFIKSRLQGRQFGLTFGNGRWKRHWLFCTCVCVFNNQTSSLTVGSLSSLSLSLLYRWERVGDGFAIHQTKQDK